MGAVDSAGGLRCVYPLKRTHSDVFVEMLTDFIAFLGTLPKNFVLKIFRADAGT